MTQMAPCRRLSWPHMLLATHISTLECPGSLQWTNQVNTMDANGSGLKQFLFFLITWVSLWVFLFLWVAREREFLSHSLAFSRSFFFQDFSLHTSLSPKYPFSLPLLISPSPLCLSFSLSLSLSLSLHFPVTNHPEGERQGKGEGARNGEWEGEGKVEGEGRARGGCRAKVSGQQGEGGVVWGFSRGVF